jgi:hypothetical protein
MDFRPQRYTVWIASSAVALLPAAFLYKQFVADDQLAAALTIFALLLGVTGAFLLMRDFGAWQEDKIAKSPVVQGAAIRAKSIGLIGLVLMVGSFALFGPLFVWPDLDFIFQVWVVLFLAGMAMAFWPVMVKWVATLMLLGRR